MRALITALTLSALIAAPALGRSASAAPPSDGVDAARARAIQECSAMQRQYPNQYGVVLRSTNTAPAGASAASRFEDALDGVPVPPADFNPPNLSHELTADTHKIALVKRGLLKSAFPR